MRRNTCRSLARLVRAISIGTLLGVGASMSARAQTTSPPPAPFTTQPPVAVTALYNKENAAIASRDYAQFVASGTATFKKALTKELFTSACANISDNLKSGYTSQFAGQWAIQGSTAYVWNLTCKNGVKYRAIMAVTGGKVSAYLYQPPQAPAS